MRKTLARTKRQKGDNVDGNNAEWKKQQLGTQSSIKLTSDGSIVDCDNKLNNVSM
jgi:hypothetical protein